MWAELTGRQAPRETQIACALAREAVVEPAVEAAVMALMPGPPQARALGAEPDPRAVEAVESRAAVPAAVVAPGLVVLAREPGPAPARR